MRLIAALAACVAFALTAASCDPVTERRYFEEGAGVDLYTPDRANQAELQNQYIDFICAQTGPDCGRNWAAFVQAGMNDIDLRCDGFLTWLDARRRDKEPILAELSALNTATNTIMFASGATPEALNIVTAAFGLATATYNNWNSRLLISVNQSTVQEVVYSSQRQFRDKIRYYVVGDRPTAIYLLRNYLRLCMPTTIEAAINTSALLVERGVPAAAQKNLVVGTVTSKPPVTSKPSVTSEPVRVRGTFVADSAGAALTKYLFPNGELAARDSAHAKVIQDFLTQNHIDVHITSFLKMDSHAAQRAQLARQLGLIP